mmetsp:Transcript_71354/g.206573  ORF Transcript_71354/g.206573 Transcript_71354/m.206573 type:complete len:203 (+) Transcript_71354:231-839(+)
MESSRTNLPTAATTSRPRSSPNRPMASNELLRTRLLVPARAVASAAAQLDIPSAVRPSMPPTTSAAAARMEKSSSVVSVTNTSGTCLCMYFPNLRRDINAEFRTTDSGSCVAKWTSFATRSCNFDSGASMKHWQPSAQAAQRRTSQSPRERQLSSSNSWFVARNLPMDLATAPRMRPSSPSFMSMPAKRDENPSLASLRSST